MTTDPQRQLPVSTRHAFALAFDLAVRRDPLHSLVVPLLLRAPWILALALLPREPDETRFAILGLSALALIGDLVTALGLGAMLRVRARSVFNTPAGARPAPAAECYRQGIRRVPWLFATEAMRNFSLGLAFVPTAFAGLSPASFLSDPGRSLPLIATSLMLMVPAVFVLYRLGVATEAVVLDERDLAGAFQSSFIRMRGHLERWFELIAGGVLLTLLPALGIAALWLVLPMLPWTTGMALLWLVVAGFWPILQYAWTFFYLRLVEIDAAAPASVAAPSGRRALEDVAPAR